jgi:hypothetical protein
MKPKDHLHCQDCGAHFEQKTQLEAHHKDCHEQREPKEKTKSSPVAQTAGDSSARKNKEFTRTHLE